MLDLEKPLVSLIIPVKNEGSHIQNTIDSVFQVKTNYSFEIIVVDDESTDRCCDFLFQSPYADLPELKLIRSKGVGPANARNIGAKHSLGQYLIFCDAHLFFEDFWIDHLLKPIKDGLADGTTPGIADTKKTNFPGYGQTLNEHLGVVWYTNTNTLAPIAVLPAGCCAISRNVFFNIGGFDTGFKGWGFEDIEISIKMWLFGYKCYAQPVVKILHVFRKSSPYHINTDNIYFNMLRMAYSHFNKERIYKCKNLIGSNRLSKIDKSVLASGVLKQRKNYFARRKYNDEWYIKTFNIPF